MKTKLSLAITLALFGAGTLTGCSNDNEPASAANTTTQQAAPAASVAAAATMLKYIPADTPYFFASRASLPEADAFALYQRMQPQGSLESDLDDLKDMLDDIHDPALYAMMNLIIAMGEELIGMNSLEEAHALGIKMSPQAAFYGLGLLPVVRMELHDETAFGATLERILARAEISLTSASTNGTEYWTLTDEGPVQAIMALIDQQLILSVVPADASDELLAQVLGSDLPARNLDDSNTLTELERQYGFTPYGAGQIYSARILNELSTPTHPGTQALMQSLEAEEVDMSACQADIDRITARFPGLVFGAREYNLNRMEVNLFIPTDSETVADLRAITAYVPGLGSTEGIGSFGLGLNLPVLMQTVQKYALEMRQNPFSCDELQDLNSTWNEVNMAINNPITMMIGPTLSGLKARLDSLSIVDGEPTGTGILSLSSQNPIALLSAAASFVPELMTLGLTPGGDVQKIESMMLPPDLPELHAVMTDSAIALGVGIADGDTLKAEINTPDNGRNLLLYGHLRGELYTALADMMELMPGGDMAEFDVDMLKQYAEIYKNMEYWIRVDDQGVEMSLALELN